MKEKILKFMMFFIFIGFTGCNDEAEIAQDPYGGGRDPFGIRLLSEPPVPDSGYPADEVVFKAEGLGDYVHGDSYDFEFYLADEKAVIVTATDTTVTIRVPDNVSTGQTFLLMQGQVFFGPAFTVLGSVSVDRDYNLFNTQKAPYGTVYDYLEYINSGNKYYYIVGEFTMLDTKQFYSIGMLDSRGNRMTHGANTPFNISAGTRGSYIDDTYTIVKERITNIDEFSDGRKLIAGNFKGFNNVTSMNNVTVLNSNLSVPTTSISFPNESGSTTNASKSNFNGGALEEVVKAFVTADQKVVAVGNITQYCSYNWAESYYNYYELEYRDVASVIRMNGSTGELDTLYRKGLTGVAGQIHDACMDKQGGIVIVGDMTGFDGRAVPNIVRIGSDGTVDDKFLANLGSGANSYINNITYNEKYGKLMITGAFTQFNGIARDGIAMLNDDGTFDAAFAPRRFEDGKPNYAKVIEEGKVVVSGTFEKYDGVYRRGFLILELDGEGLQRYNVPGKFDGQVYQVIETETTTGGNGLLLFGDFTRFNNERVRNAVMLNMDYD
jgi:hypothetical protein